ncbi:SlyX family protein [Piscinibacter sakaiensis]|uniref:Protein slyX homolog n=1 Tax=Piscinibacter sakaiensis TaxID=1547922 RepID=A0A0K8P832_PISS1|nr:SlyX family protein [Piscinibacter sakaiensis]GAP38360.1 protein slyX homolog [Piscinibacter sakaiensis]
MSGVDERLTALEIKASYGEDLLDRLNEVIVRQQREIDRLTAAVAALQRQVEALPAGPAFRSLRDELPPHY